jgi:hypothetical protein
MGRLLEARDEMKEKIFDYIYLVWYSFKELLWDNIVTILREIKRPATWSIIFYCLLGYSLWVKDMRLFRLLIVPTILIYLLRQKREGAYRVPMKIYAIKHNMEYLINKEYEKYKKECYFNNSEPKQLEQWKSEQVERFEKDKSD